MDGVFTRLYFDHENDTIVPEAHVTVAMGRAAEHFMRYTPIRDGDSLDDIRRRKSELYLDN